MRNFFLDICESEDKSIERYIDALDTIYAEESYEIDSFYSDGVFTEDESEGFKLKEKAKKAGEYIKKAVDMIISKIKEFGRMIAEKITLFIARSEFKKAIKAAQENARDSKDTIELEDLPKVYKLNKQVHKDFEDILRKLPTDFRNEFNEDEYEKLHEKTTDIINKYNDKYDKIKTVTVSVSDAAKIVGDFMKRIGTNPLYEWDTTMQCIKNIAKSSGPQSPSRVVDIMQQIVSFLKKVTSSFATITMESAAQLAHLSLKLSYS